MLSHHGAGLVYQGDGGLESVASVQDLGMEGGSGTGSL